MSAKTTLDDIYEILDFIPLPGVCWLEYEEKDGRIAQSEMPGLVKVKHQGVEKVHSDDDGTILSIEQFPGDDEIEFHAADMMDGEIVRAATFKNFRGAQAMRHSFRDA